MRLVVESELRDAIDLSPLPQYVAAANTALNTATLALENDLRTQFERATQTDVFRPYANEPSNILKLKRAFIQSDPAVVVTYAVTPYARSSGETTDITAICTIDYEKGLVCVGGESAENAFFYGVAGADIRVTYTAGFLASEADPDLFNPLSVPGWLKNLALLLGQINIATHPAVKPTDAVPDVDQLKSQYAASISSRSRYSPSAILPAF